MSPRLLTGPWGHLPGAPRWPQLPSSYALSWLWPQASGTSSALRAVLHWGLRSRPGTCLSRQHWEQGCLGSPAQWGTTPCPGGRRSLVTISGAVCDSAPGHRGGGGQDSGAGPRPATRLCPGPPACSSGQGPPRGTPAAGRARRPVRTTPRPSPLQRPAQRPPALGPWLGCRAGRLGPLGPVGTVCPRACRGLAQGDPAPSGGLPVDAGRSRSPSA